MRRLGQMAGRLLFPHACVSCGAEGGLMCGDCLNEIGAPATGLFVCPGCGLATPLGGVCDGCRGRSHLDGAVAYAPYARSVPRELLRLWKYEGTAEAERLAAGMFAAFIEARATFFNEWLGDGGCFMPVPLNWFRLARRGFNQSAILAKAAAGALGAGYRAGLLRRRFGWRAQAMIGDRQRRAINVRGVFRLVPGAAPPRRVVLIDDVMTTGATLQDAARALKEGGAEKVFAVIFLLG